MRRHCSCHCPVCRASRNGCFPLCSLYMPQPCVCPPGPPGAAATVTIGTVTTGAPGTPITFDRNALSLGTDISHTSGSDTFTINQPGVYSVEFHGVITPTANNTFPVNINTSLEVNGSVQPGASVPFTFQNATQSSEVSFTVPISVTDVPTTLQVAPFGGNYLADAVSMTVTRLGNN